MRYHTEGVYNYDRATYVVASVTAMKFKVQICKDAIVGLFSNMGENVAYEIVIGGSGNNITGIRKERVQVSASVKVFHYLGTPIYAL